MGKLQGESDEWDKIEVRGSLDTEPYRRVPRAATSLEETLGVLFFTGCARHDMSTVQSKARGFQGVGAKQGRRALLPRARAVFLLHAPGKVPGRAIVRGRHRVPVTP